MPYAKSAYRPFLGLILILLFGNLTLADVPDRIDVYKPLPSTGILLTSSAQGTGFLVDRAERLLITNHHVAQTNLELNAIFPVYDMGMVLVRRDYYFKNAPRIACKCLISDAQHDLAIVQLKTAPQEVPEVKLAAQRPKLGERVHLLGNPGKSEQVWVYGSGTVKMAGEAIMKFSKEFEVQSRILTLQTDDRKIGPGASGGPVVNNRGELVGVIQSGPPDSSHVTCIEVGEVRVFLGDYHRNLATKALRSKDYAEAISRATKAVQINPEDALAYNERATAYSYQTRYDEALADYTAALKIDPKLSRTWRSRASANYFKGNFDQAVADCTEAIKLDPKYAQAYLSRSKANGKLGKYVESRSDYDAAIRLDPSLR